MGTCQKVKQATPAPAAGRKKRRQKDRHALYADLVKEDEAADGRQQTLELKLQDMRQDFMLKMEEARTEIQAKASEEERGYQEEREAKRREYDEELQRKEREYNEKRQRE